MEFSINGGTAKCMVYEGIPIKMDDSGVPTFNVCGNLQIMYSEFVFQGAASPSF